MTSLGTSSLQSSVHQDRSTSRHLEYFTVPSVAVQLGHSYIAGVSSKLSRKLLLISSGQPSNNLRRHPLWLITDQFGDMLAIYWSSRPNCCLLLSCNLANHRLGQAGAPAIGPQMTSCAFIGWSVLACCLGLKEAEISF